MVSEKLKDFTHGILKHSFLFTELVKRDFKEKYKRTVLGMGWSILSPLLTLLVMRMVFTQFFGRNTPHYTTYLFCGTLVMNFYKECTRGGMNSITGNASIITKIRMPKYMFLLSKSVSSVINFLLTMCVFFLFCLLDGITFGWHFFMLLYPVLCVIVFSLGAGLVLSTLNVFFMDTKYLYDIFLTLLTYLSAIFYQVDSYPEKVQRLFLMNPVYCYIKYFRIITIQGTLPGLAFHGLCLGYAVIMLLFGMLVYSKNSKRFLYYL